MRSEHLRGGALVLLSAVFFALATVFVKLATTDTQLTGRLLTFARFAFGLVAASIMVRARGERLRLINVRHIVLRAVFNALAVLLFFTGLEYTTVTNANMLNMSYPVFVFLAAPVVNRETSPARYYVYLLLTLVGVWLIVTPSRISPGAVNAGDLLAMGSAVAAGLAITSLREARKSDSSLAILFSMMGIGTVATFFVMLPGVVVPHAQEWLYVIGAAASSFLGQVSLTVGYRHITAAGGAIISSSRMLFAGLLGALFFQDPITAGTVLGGACILMSLIGVSGLYKPAALR